MSLIRWINRSVCFVFCDSLCALFFGGVESAARSLLGCNRFAFDRRLGPFAGIYRTCCGAVFGRMRSGVQRLLFDRQPLSRLHRRPSKKGAGQASSFPSHLRPCRGLPAIVQTSTCSRSVSKSIMQAATMCSRSMSNHTHFHTLFDWRAHARPDMSAVTPK